MMRSKNMVAIAAMGINGEIGVDNRLLCKLKDDLRIFHQMTDGNLIVMGRKTHESIGRRLVNRTNIILTTDHDYAAPNCLVMHSVEEVLDYFHQQDRDMFVIGGQAIYDHFLPYCNGLALTHIQAAFEEADTFFPEIEWSDWKQSGRGEFHPAGEGNDKSFFFNTYLRRGAV